MKNKLFYSLTLTSLFISLLFVLLNVKFHAVYIIAFFISVTSILLVKRSIIYFCAVFIFSFFPQDNKFNLLPAIDTNLNLVLLLIFVVLFLTKINFSKSYNKLWLSYIIVVVYGLIIGLISHNEQKFIVDELVKYLFYPIGFYFCISIFENINIDSFLKVFFKFNLIMGLIIVIQIFTYYFLFSFGSRVFFRPSNLLLLSELTALSLLFYKKNLSLLKKIILISLILLYTFGILIFMQRSLWIATIFSVSIFMIIYSFRSNFSKKKIIKVLTFFVLAFLIILFLFTNSVFYSTVFSSRTSDVEEQGIQTFSIAARLVSYFEILQKIRQHWLLGLGVGDTLKTTYLNMRVINIVDNSFVVILWKFGLVGLGIFALIYLTGLKQLLYLIKNSDNNILIFSIIIFTNLVGQIINSLACVILILYSFNFIWTSHLAFTNVIFLESKNKTIHAN